MRTTRRARLRASEAQALKPFVVLVDVTIALSFILVVFALTSTMQSSQSLLAMNRQERQRHVREALLNEVQKRFPESSVAAFDPNRRRQSITGKDGERLVDLFENGSYQRISLYFPQFKKDSSNLVPSASDVMLALGSVIKSNWNTISYLNLHGIASSSEGVQASTRDAVSRSRAESVLRLFQRHDVVGRNADDARAGVVPLKFAVAYGTGSNLYADFRMNSRVDIVLFYSDSQEGREIGAEG